MTYYVLIDTLGFDIYSLEHLCIMDYDYFYCDYRNNIVKLEIKNTNTKILKTSSIRKIFDEL